MSGTSSFLNVTMNTDDMLIEIQFVCKSFTCHKSSVRMVKLSEQESFWVLIANQVACPPIRPSGVGSFMAGHCTLDFHYSTFQVLYLQLLQRSIFQLRITTVLVCQNTPVEWRLKVFNSIIKTQSNSQQIIRVTISLNNRKKALLISFLT